MKSIIGLILLSILLVVSNAAKESNESEEHKDEHSHEGKIKQCTCTELHDCNADLRKKVRPCMEKCAEKLELSNWDAEEGRKCFIHKEPNKPRCMEEIKKKTCAAEDGILINKNETLHHHKHKNHSRHHLDENTLETSSHPSTHGHGGRFGFFAFLRTNFGDSAKEYFKCAKKCTKGNRRGTCARKLKCGVKRLSPEDLKTGFSRCRSEHAEKRKELCACLEKAGAKNIQCEAKKNPESSEEGENKVN